MLGTKPEGNYHYLPITIESEPQEWEVPFCCGVVADAGYEIVRATFERPVPWQDGFSLIDRHLKAIKRPCQALCGIELLCAAPYTREGFLEFNGKYAEVLTKWGFDASGVPALGVLKRLWNDAVAPGPTDKLREEQIKLWGLPRESPP